MFPNSTPSQLPEDRGRSKPPLEQAIPAEGTAAQPPANRRDKRRPLALPDVIESTHTRARSDTGAGDLHSGFPNDARRES